MVGTRTPDGGLQKPSIGPEKQRGKWKLKKKAKVMNMQQRIMNPDPNKPASPFKIEPAQWEDTSLTINNKNSKMSLK